MIVVDASCVVEVLLRTSSAEAIESRWRRETTLHAPEIIDLEILQVMRRLVALRELSDDRAALAVDMLERLALRRWSHGALRRRIWALRRNLTAYDAAYVALAERIGCPLVTRDSRLARSAGHGARIERV
ncbi:MAG TPA: type II toxin-antitoxin system VapC family toxin [Candidatus Binatia bacterium]|nr:type II toxin-antitoxin system VapC family toxin [Candidatus Binatia bacterium]